MRSSVPHLCIIPSLFVPVHPYSMNTTQTDHVSDHPHALEQKLFFTVHVDKSYNLNMVFHIE